MKAFASIIIFAFIAALVGCSGNRLVQTPENAANPKQFQLDKSDIVVAYNNLLPGRVEVKDVNKGITVGYLEPAPNGAKRLAHGNYETYESRRVYNRNYHGKELTIFYVKVVFVLTTPTPEGTFASEIKTIEATLISIPSVNVTEEFFPQYSGIMKERAKRH